MIWIQPTSGFMYALLCITIVPKIAYLLTRLCFGISSRPGERCLLILETMINIVSILIEDKSWNPLGLFNLSKDKQTIPSFEKQVIQLQKSKRVIYYLPIKETYVDGYINVLSSIILYSEHLILREAHAVPHRCPRPLQ